MRTVRRLYFYAVALISLEVLIWGVVGLARNAVNLLPGATSVLASGLALVLVGLPVFVLHWSLAQREAYRDDDERASRMRAVFFYATLFAVLIPVLYAVQAILNRWFFTGLGLEPGGAMAGGGQSTTDNVIAIAINLAAFAYFLRDLQKDWQANIPGNSLAEVRRLYRYLWMLYGLILMIAGIRLVLYFLLYIPTGLTEITEASLGNGLALLVVGAPLWVYTGWLIQESLDQSEENRSLLRLVVLYLLSLVGVITTLLSAGEVLSAGLRRLLGESGLLMDFINQQAGTIATLVPMAVVWAYYSRQLNRELAGVPDEPRRAALRRIYYYLLSLLGNAAVFGGFQQGLSFLAQSLSSSFTLYETLRIQLSVAISALVVGLPVWLNSWTRMQAEAARLDDTGDHARRSAIRKAYLYLVLFLSVAGAMVSGGQLLYLIFTNVLGQSTPGFLTEALDWLQTLVLTLVWLAYHLRALRYDGRLAQRSLGERHASFPVLILQADNESFTVEIVQALQRLAPRMPIIVHNTETGAPGEDLLSAKVVILPAWLAMKPGEALRLWLNDFQGKRVLIPGSLGNWIWLGTLPKDERDLAREAASAVRQIAEGQEVRASPPTNPWAVVGYILGALFGFILLAIAVSLVIGGIR